MNGKGRNASPSLHRPLSVCGDIPADATRPRVLMVTPQPFFEERGTPIAVAMAARALVESGYAVDVLAFPVGTDPGIEGVRIERCANPFGFRHIRVGFSLRKALLDLSLLRSLARLLSARMYSVVHAVEEAAWLAALLCPRRNVPFIYDMASSIPEQLVEHRLLGRAPAQAMLRAMERRVIDRSAHVVCSGGLGSYVRRISPLASFTEWRFPVLQQQATPEAVARLREQHAIDAAHRVLLYTGNFSSYQGIDLLLEAFMHAAAVDQHLLLVCVGATDARQADELAGRLPAALHARVRILPRVERAMMPAWFQVAHCLISLRTLGDNIPLKVFEYMASTRPIVASRGPAHEPILDDSRAFLCDPDPDDVARAIQQVFAQPAHARRVAQAAGAYASRYFSWTRFRQLVGGIYARVLHSPVALADRSAIRQI